MRVHILGTRGYPSSYGGFETLLRHLAPYLVRRGHQVSVFDRRGPTDPSRRDDLAPDVAATARNGGSWDVGGVRVRRSRGLSGSSTSTLTHGLTSAVVTAKERPDVALVMNVANGFFLPALRSRGVPTVLNVDGIEWERAKWSPMGRYVFRSGARLSARWADTLVADSRAIGARWETEFGRRSVFIPYGGDQNPPADRERLSPWGLVPGSYLLIVARLVPENNVVPMLRGALLTGAAVVVVGSGAGSATEREVAALGGHPQVITLGHVADQQLLSTLWTHCGAYLHGHSVGGTNPALLQAMGLGAPVLALDTPYNREVLVDPRHLVPLDPEVVGQRLRELLGSPILRGELVRSARRRVLDVYNWTSVCQAYESALLDRVAH